MMSAKAKKMTAPRMHHAITHLAFTSAAAMKDLLMCTQKGLEEAVKAKKNFIIEWLAECLVIWSLLDRGHTCHTI